MLEMGSTRNLAIDAVEPPWPLALTSLLAIINSRWPVLS